ncbi:TPA: peptidyl-prolyl cis-trans isomerase [Candidatus Poribacteria bacterium]|nr:peptidyl-prolyl cis-trans isomerase [Candidatus Poribacteria bacterium]
MKKPFLYLTCFGLALMSLSIVSCGTKEVNATEGTVLAEFDWNGEHHTVTLEEMEQEISELPEYKQDDYEGKEGMEEYLTLMAESRMLLLLAKDRKLNEDAEILKKVDEYLHQLMVEKITEIEVDNKIKWTEEELKQYYEEHKEDYIDPEQVRVTCVTVDDEELAQELMSEIKEGKDIAEVAKELSEQRKNIGPGGGNNGDTGFFSRNSYSVAKDFVEMAFAMKVGEMTDEVFEQDVEGPDGATTYYMIFRKEEHKPERQKEFTEEDVREDVEREVEKARREKLMNEWVEGLKKKAKLQLYLDKVTGEPEEEEKAEVGQKPEEGKQAGEEQKSEEK